MNHFNIHLLKQIFAKLMHERLLISTKLASMNSFDPSRLMRYVGVHFEIHFKGNSNIACIVYCYAADSLKAIGKKILARKRDKELNVWQPAETSNARTTTA